jgi:hypothetical protein
VAALIEVKAPGLHFAEKPLRTHVFRRDVLRIEWLRRVPGDQAKGRMK